MRQVCQWIFPKPVLNGTSWAGWPKSSIGITRGLSYPALLQRLAAARGHIIELVEARSDLQLYGCLWYEKWTLGRMIQFNSASPYLNANGRLRKWLKELASRV